MIKIFPSILSADFSRLGDELRSLTNDNADGIHIDVMDGNFVDNITIGIPVVRDIRKCTNIFFDVHLMINSPEKYIERFAEAGADSITFHVEASENPYKIIDLIRATGKKVGISIKPETNLPDSDILKDVDIVLVMSVNPGFGGQKYIEEVNKKIELLSKIRYENDLHFEIEVDGGINKVTIIDAAKAGADIFVAGTAVFGEKDREKAMRDLKKCAEK